MQRVLLICGVLNGPGRLIRKTIGYECVAYPSMLEPAVGNRSLASGTAASVRMQAVNQLQVELATA